MIKDKNTYLPAKLAHDFKVQVGMCIFWNSVVNQKIKFLSCFILIFCFALGYSSGIKNDSIGKIYISSTATVYSTSETDIHGKIIHLNSKTRAELPKLKPVGNKIQIKEHKEDVSTSQNTQEPKQRIHFIPYKSSDSFSLAFNKTQCCIVTSEHQKSRSGKAILKESFSIVFQLPYDFEIQNVNTYTSTDIKDYFISKNLSVRPPPHKSFII